MTVYLCQAEGQTVGHHSRDRRPVPHYGMNRVWHGVGTRGLVDLLTTTTTRRSLSTMTSFFTEVRQGDERMYAMHFGNSGEDALDKLADAVEPNGGNTPGAQLSFAPEAYTPVRAKQHVSAFRCCQSRLRLPLRAERDLPCQASQRGDRVRKTTGSLANVELRARRDRPRGQRSNCNSERKRWIEG